MTMLEKIAKAMHEAHQSRIVVGTLSWDDQNSYVKSGWNKFARAAIEELKEPTPDMRIAGGIALASAMQTAETLVDPADACWKAMFDQILKEDV